MTLIWLTYQVTTKPLGAHGIQDLSYSYTMLPWPNCAALLSATVHHHIMTHLMY